MQSILQTFALLYAKSRGFKIDTSMRARTYLQFANGSYQETVGQVHTYWTFSSGETLPITFEVLEDCASEVILGEEFLYEHNVYEAFHSTKISATEEQQCVSCTTKCFGWTRSRKELRQENWNRQYDFGKQANINERDAETKRRNAFVEMVRRVGIGNRIIQLPGLGDEEVIKGPPNTRDLLHSSLRHGCGMSIGSYLVYMY
ncbi:hypothetical protein BJ875DRAFT_445150 [Amylocarpus encephaloides]|uniref:Uncharacterized protein n=1 Tax=Amylocarpus encephaloides TaxID=45428 RepID=A0A9P7YAU0_9HELO|nr:hypothetical protein BJ875DRAFT_445150 [Amylocarpus encephaloides]